MLYSFIHTIRCYFPFSLPLALELSARRQKSENRWVIKLLSQHKRKLVEKLFSRSCSHTKMTMEIIIRIGFSSSLTLIISLALALTLCALMRVRNHTIGIKNEREREQLKEVKSTYSDSSHCITHQMAPKCTIKRAKISIDLRKLFQMSRL